MLKNYKQQDRQCIYKQQDRQCIYKQQDRQCIYKQQDRQCIYKQQDRQCIYKQQDRQCIYKQQDRQCIYKRNIEALSSNHCCSRKTMSITYCKCVFVALVIQHAKCMRCVMLHLTVRFYYIFPHYLINGTIFQNKLLNTQCLFRSFSTFVRNVSNSKRK